MDLIRSISFAFQEQELYQREGLGVNEVHYVDNQDCIGTETPLIFLHSWLCIQSSSSWSSSVCVPLGSECFSVNVLNIYFFLLSQSTLCVEHNVRKKKRTQTAGHADP